jgi:hypothetical protein
MKRGTGLISLMLVQEQTLALLLLLVLRQTPECSLVAGL